jgi:hypothetical protein
MAPKFFKWSLIGLLAAVFASLVFILRPVPALTSENAELVRGTVQAIFEGGEKDLCFQLKEHRGRFGK